MSRCPGLVSVLASLCWVLCVLKAMAGRTPTDAGDRSAFASTLSPSVSSSTCEASARAFPTVFVCHGGGPLPLTDDPAHAALKASLQQLQGQVLGGRRPAAVLVISAHFETSASASKGQSQGQSASQGQSGSEGHAVTSSAAPGLLYDYYGFPQHLYSLEYPVRGDPALARRVVSLLSSAGLPAREEAARGLDHGVFVPLMLAFPNADVPVVQLSLLDHMDPEHHLRLGQALRPLAQQGDVLILGSGMSFHNLRALLSRGGGGGRGEGSESSNSKSNRALSEPFDDYLYRACTEEELAPAQRLAMLRDWEQAPGAREAHPREEHLLPLLVVAAAAGGSTGRRIFHGELAGALISSYAFPVEIQ